MKVKLEQLKAAGIQTGCAFGGFVASHTANQMASKMAPAKIAKFVPYGTLALGVAIAAISKNDAVQAFGVGVAAHGLIKSVNNFTAPSLDEAGNSLPATGVKAMIGQYVPQLNGLEDASWGMGYVGSFPEYDETPLMMGIGNTEEMPVENAEWM